MKEPQVGDVVIVYEDGVKSNHWKMAVIEDLIKRKRQAGKGGKGKGNN